MNDSMELEALAGSMNTGTGGTANSGINNSSISWGSTMENYLKEAHLIKIQ